MYNHNGIAGQQQTQPHNPYQPTAPRYQHDQSTTVTDPAASRRPSISDGPGAQPSYNGYGTNNGHETYGNGAKPVSDPALTGEKPPLVLAAPIAPPKRKWSRKKKTCCCVCTTLLVIIIILACVIPFLVQIPTVSYKSHQITCPGNNVQRCVTEMIFVLVVLEVDNPNIIGATIDADLGLFQQGGTFMGPGRIDDVHVQDSAITPINARFNVSAQRAPAVIADLFLPPAHDVPMYVEGTVYVHVGLLRPSFTIHENFVIPAQSLSDLQSMLPPTDKIIGAIGDAIGGQLPDVNLPDVSVPDINLPFSIQPKQTTRTNRITMAIPEQSSHTTDDATTSTLPPSDSAANDARSAKQDMAPPTSLHATSTPRSIPIRLDRQIIHAVLTHEHMHASEPSPNPSSNSKRNRGRNIHHNKLNRIIGSMPIHMKVKPSLDASNAQHTRTDQRQD